MPQTWWQTLSSLLMRRIGCIPIYLVDSQSACMAAKKLCGYQVMTLEISISALITHRDKHLEGNMPLGLGRLPWLSKKVAFAVSPTVISLTTNTNPFGLYTPELPFLGMGDPALDESSKTSLSNQLTTRGLLNTGGVDVSLLSEHLIHATNCAISPPS